MRATGYYQGWTEEEVKQHIVEEYQGYYSGEEPVTEEQIVADLENTKLIFAWQSSPDYDESSFFLFASEDGRLWENEADHCSCFTWEGQWNPVESSADYILSDQFKARGFLSEEDHAYVREYLETLQ